MSQAAEVRPSGWLAVLLTPLVVVALAVAAAVAAVSGDEQPPADHPAGEIMTPPLELASVDDAIAEHYRYAADHQAAYADIPCYCGCHGFLDHRNLYDCFVRADGEGWDAHASGCAVCIAESSAARQLLDAGDDPAAVRAAVVAQFGSTPTTAPA